MVCFSKAEIVLSNATLWELCCGRMQCFGGMFAFGWCFPKESLVWGPEGLLRTGLGLSQAYRSGMRLIHWATTVFCHPTLGTVKDGLSFPCSSGKSTQDQASATSCSPWQPRNPTVAGPGSGEWKVCIPFLSRIV